MIPHRLRLHNFMCYREEQSLDFTGIHLACLAGDNGHGKSALLDAMTWAVWGKARCRRDDDLVTLGESDMWVDFEFGFGPQRYRIWRQRSRKGRGQSDLHFYIWREGSGNPSPDDCWQLLDEGGIVDRQAQIVRTLSLDYDTFINSALLLQNRADSFTVKTPSERKQILGDILGLGRYEQYEERAKEEAQRRKNQAERIQGETAGIDRELAKRPLYEAQLETARARVTGAGQALRAAEAEQGRLRLAVQSAQEQARQLGELRGRMARAQRDLGEVRQQQVQAQARVAQYERILADREQIEAGWAQLQAARKEDAAWNERLLRHSHLQEEMNRVRMVVNQAQLGLEGECRRLADRQQELERRVAAGQSQATILLQVQEVLTRLASQAVRRDIIHSELREVGEGIATLRAENERLKLEGQGIREKVAMLSDAESAACPLCRQPLSDTHRVEMLAAFGQERDAMVARFQAHQKDMRTLAERKTALEAEDAGLERELRAQEARQRQAAQAETAVADGQAATAELQSITEQLAELQARLAAKDYARAEQERLAQLSEELALSGYDGAAHRAVRTEAQKLEPFDARYQRQLLPAIEGIEEARAHTDSLASQVARRESEIAEDTTRAEVLAAGLAGLPALQHELGRATEAVEQAMVEERRARQEEGAAMQQLHVLSALAERRSELAKSLETINEEISIYNQLREAFGKKGLQAMIIESAIPEVEVEANRLLSRMSEGRMSLRLETQREKVTGGIAETLDIIIADELGGRTYESYSGGEAFRANLALRIAISKLLARRAGAPLQTLVIDEGFGTQDSLGRTLLVEAINSIQQDFERILVITHIDEIKDLFPARIDVIKTPSGSRVSIS